MIWISVIRQQIQNVSECAFKKKKKKNSIIISIIRVFRGIFRGLKELGLQIEKING